MKGKVLREHKVAALRSYEYLMTEAGLTFRPTTEVEVTQYSNEDIDHLIKQYQSELRTAGAIVRRT